MKTIQVTNMVCSSIKIKFSDSSISFSKSILSVPVEWLTIN